MTDTKDQRGGAALPPLFFLFFGSHQSQLAIHQHTQHQALLTKESWESRINIAPTPSQSVLNHRLETPPPSYKPYDVLDVVRAAEQSVNDEIRARFVAISTIAGAIQDSFTTLKHPARAYASLLLPKVSALLLQACPRLDNYSGPTTSPPYVVPHKRHLTPPPCHVILPPPPNQTTSLRRGGSSASGRSSVPSRSIRRLSPSSRKKWTATADHLQHMRGFTI